MTTILDKFKIDVPIISDGFKDLASKISNMTPDDYPKKWKEWAKSFEVTDKSAIKFFEDVDNGKRDISDIDDYIANATSVKTIGKNIAIMLAITVAIKTVSAIWDKVNVTVAETQEKIDELSSSISTLESEYNELNSKENLTDSEKARLEYLEDRISLEERLLKAQEERLVKEKYGSKFTDYFDKDSYAHKTYFDSDNSLYNETDKKTDRTQYNVDEYKKAVENDDAEKQLEYTERLEAKRLEHEEKYLKNQQAISDIQEDINNKLITEEEADKWIQKYQNSADYAKKQMDLIDSVIPHAESASEKLVNNLKGITEKDLTDAFNADDLEKLSSLEFGVDYDEETTIEEFEELLDKIQLDADGNPIVVDTEFDTDTQGSLSKASKSIKTLESAYEEFKKNGFVLAETLSSIPEEFNQLEGYDLFSKIVGDPTNGKEKIQQAFNDIVKEYLIKSKTMNGLINSDESTVQTYIANLKAMGIANAEEMVNQYITAINSESQLIKDAETELLNGHIQYVNGKIQIDTDYVNDVSSQNSKLVSALGSAYSGDYNNWKTLLAQKASAYNNFVNAINGSQINLGNGSAALSEQGRAKAQAQAIIDNVNKFGVKKNISDNLKNGTTGLLNTKTNGKYTQSEYEAAKALMSTYSQYDSMKNALKLDLSTVNTNFGSTYSPSSGKSSGSSKTAETNKDVAETFDLIEIKIDRVESKISKYNKLAENTYRSIKARAASYKSEISSLVSEIKTQEKAYNKYMEKANSIGLSKVWKQRVEDGAVSLKDVTNDTLKEQIKQYQTYYEKALKAKEATSELTSTIREECEAMAKLNAEYAESKIDKYSSSIDLLNAKKENSSTYKDKNSLLKKETSYLNKELDSYKKAYKDDLTSLNSTKKSINKTKSTKKNKSVLKTVKSCIKGKKEISQGTLDKVFKVDKSLYEKCVKYNAYLTAYETDKATYDLQKQEITSRKAEIAQEKIDNIKKYYSDRTDVYDQKATKINNAIDLNSAKGYQTSKTYYSKLISNEKNTNKKLTEEKNKLVSSLASSIKSGEIRKGSEAWYEMCQQIDEVTNAIDESNISLVEYQNQLRQIDWDNFDYLEERIKNITSELDFAINELSRKDLTDDETGGLTNNGQAVTYLHASNYTTYTQQAKDYENEIKKIESSLAKNPYDKNLIERKKELVSAYQDSIAAAQDEKYAIIDLYTQGYDALQNKISDLISEYEKLLDAEKNAYDWQNTVSDKTKEIANIRKQLAAYSNDVSEETRSKIQSLNISLQDAEKDLKDSQYDKFVTDTKDMLSDLQDKMGDIIEDVVKSMNDNFEELMKKISSSSKDSANTIKKSMTGIGYTTTNEFSSILNGSDVSQSTKNMITETKAFQTKMTAYVDSISKSLSVVTATDETNKKVQSDGLTSLSKAASSANAQVSKTVDKYKDAKNDKLHAQEIMNAAKKKYDNYVKTHDMSNAKNKKKAAEYEQEYKDAKAVYDSKNKKYKEMSVKYSNLKKKSTALTYLKSHLDVTKTSRGDLSDINKVFYDEFGQRILSSSELKELAKKLGITYNNSSSSGNLYKKLKEIGVNGFSVGSKRIPYEQLALLGEKGMEVRYNNEQGILQTVGKGDKVFTSEMTDNLWKIAQNPNLLASNLNFTPPTPFVPNLDRNAGATVVEIGDINMYEVNDIETFGKQLRTEICKGGKTTKCVTEAVSSMQLGKGIGKAKLYK